MTPEHFISILGLRQILGLSALNPNKKAIASAIKLPNTIEIMVEDFLHGDVTPRPDPLKYDDLEWIIPALAKIDPMTVVTEIGPELLRHDISIDIAPKIVELLTYLQTHIPDNEILDNPLMLDDAPSRSISKSIRFLWVCRLIDDPLYLISLMQQYQLSKKDALVVQEAYPEIYEAIVNEMIQGVVNTFKINTPSSRQTKTQLSILLQIPVINAKTLSAYREKPKPEPTKSQKSPNVTSPEVE